MLSEIVRCCLILLNIVRKRKETSSEFFLYDISFANYIPFSPYKHNFGDDNTYLRYG